MVTKIPGDLEVMNTTINKPVVFIYPNYPQAMLKISSQNDAESSTQITPSAFRLLANGLVGAPAIHLLTDSGLARFGGKPKNGILVVVSSDGGVKFRCNADEGNCQIGGNGGDGQLTLSGSPAENPAPNPNYPQEGLAPKTARAARVLLRALDAVIRAGGNGKDGDLKLSASAATDPDSIKESVIHLRAIDATVRAGGNGKNGEILIFPTKAKVLDISSKTSGESVINLRAADASIRVGGNGTNGQVYLHNAAHQRVIQLNGETGDILLENADCAEDFDVDDPALEPGSVLVLSDEPGRLCMSDAPYDTRVAGILSGAGDYRPAIVLDRKPGREDRRPVALVGKAWCKVEAQSTPIAVGSLLTTSSLPGHAMAVTDRERAFGAVLGKALAPLAAGVGVVPVLVALQ